MADTPNPRTVYANDILYTTYRASVWLNIANRTWEAGLANAKSVVVPDMTANIKVDNPADADALQNAGVYTNATIAGVTMTRGFARATGMVNLATVQEAGGGSQLEMQLNERTGIEMALNIDEKISGAVEALSYEAAPGSDPTKGKTITVGNASNFIPVAFPYTETGKAAEELADALLAARALLAQKNVVDGVIVGAGAGTSDLVAVLPYALALNLVKFLRSEGELIDRTSIAGQAAIEGGIASLSAFMGRYAGIDIVASDGAGIASTSKTWKAYVVPSGGPLAAASFMPEIDTQRFGDGTTEGRFEMRRTAISRYAVKIMRPEHLVQLSVTQKA